MGRCKEYIGPIIALISVVMGITITAAAIYYLVYSVEIQEITKAKLIVCATVGAMPKFVAKMALNRKGKERCKFWKHQTAAGSLGIAFGCLQILTSIAALIFRKIGWKIWIGVNIFSLLATVAAAALLFIMYAEEEEPDDDKVMLGDMMPESLCKILPEPLRKLPILPTNLSDPTFVLKLGQKFIPSNLPGLNMLGPPKSNDGGEQKQSRMLGPPKSNDGGEQNQSRMLRPPKSNDGGEQKQSRMLGPPKSNDGGEQTQSRMLGPPKSNDGGEQNQSRSNILRFMKNKTSRYFVNPSIGNFKTKQLPGLGEPLNLLGKPLSLVGNLPGSGDLAGIVPLTPKDLMNMSHHFGIINSAMETAQKLANRTLHTAGNLTRSLNIAPEELTNLIFLPIKLLGNATALLPPYLRNLNLVSDFFNTLQIIPNMLKNLTNFLPKNLQRTPDPKEKEKFEKEKNTLLAYAIICTVDSIFILLALVLLCIFQPWALVRVKPAADDNEPEKEQAQDKDLKPDKAKKEVADKDKKELEPDEDQKELHPDKQKKKRRPTRYYDDDDDDDDDEEYVRPVKEKKKRRRRYYDDAIDDDEDNDDEEDFHPVRVKKKRRRSSDDDDDDDEEEVHPVKKKKKRRSSDEQELHPAKIKKERRLSQNKKDQHSDDHEDEEEIQPDKVKKKRRRSSDDQEDHPDKVKKGRRRSSDEQEVHPDNVKKERRRSSDDKEQNPGKVKKESVPGKVKKESVPGKVKKESVPGKGKKAGTDKVIYLKVKKKSR